MKPTKEQLLELACVLPGWNTGEELVGVPSGHLRALLDDYRARGEALRKIVGLYHPQNSWAKVAIEALEDAGDV